MLTHSREPQRKRFENQSAPFLGRFVIPFNCGIPIQGGSFDMSLMYINHKTLGFFYNRVQDKKKNRKIEFKSKALQ